MTTPPPRRPGDDHDPGDPGPFPAPADSEPYDLLGVGVGPFNLSLAALADPLPGLRTTFLDRSPAFSWHPGMLIDGATLQVPFLADLVTLVDPTSRWSFLNYLRSRERLFPFYFAERFHIHRAEYDAYCRWVAESLPGVRFGHQADAVRWNPARGVFEVDHTLVTPEGDAMALGREHARNLVIGVGTEPYVPDVLRPLVESGASAASAAGAVNGSGGAGGASGVPLVVHSAHYVQHRERLLAADHVTVVGSGQSGAEVFLDLLRARPEGRERLAWVARTPAFAPMEYSKLGLEHFTPDYTRYFHALAEPVRDELVAAQWQLHKGIDQETIAAIHDELYRRTLHGGWPDAVLTPGVAVRTAGRLGAHAVELHLEHREQGTRSRLTTSAVVLATGYRERPLDELLAPLDPYLARDSAGRVEVDEEYRLVLDPVIGGAIHVQNAERHTHGVGAPDLGLAAWRAAAVLNAVTGREVYPLPARTAFTTFGLPGLRTPAQRTAPGGPGRSLERAAAHLHHLSTPFNAEGVDPS